MEFISAWTDEENENSKRKSKGKECLGSNDQNNVKEEQNNVNEEQKNGKEEQNNGKEEQNNEGKYNNFNKID